VNKVYINNLVGKRIGKNRLKKLAHKILADHEIDNMKLSITFISDDDMTTLNKKYTGRDGTTDVLAFRVDTNLPKDVVLGDIYISYDEIERQSKEFNEPKQKILLRVFCHGVLHVIGLDHGKEMRSKEDKYINLVI